MTINAVKLSMGINIIYRMSNLYSEEITYYLAQEIKQ